MKEKIEDKSVDIFQHPLSFEVLESFIAGAIIGGWKINEEKEIEFNKIGILYGSLIAPLSVLLGSKYTALVGFLLYHNEGAFIGAIVGSSGEACLGALCGLIMTCSYQGVLLGIAAGYAVKNIEYIYYKNDYVDVLKGVFNFTESPHLRGSLDFTGKNSYEFDNNTMSYQYENDQPII